MAKIIILEDLNFTWEKEVINTVKFLWDSGLSFPDICEEVNRAQDETFLLLLHLSRAGKISKRNNFLWGTIKS